MMKIAIGCDDAAVELKEVLKNYLEDLGYEYNDFGVVEDESAIYPDIAVRVASAVASGDYSRGILVCGTGIGMAITANKVPGIRAAVCHDTYSAERARKSNDAQIMTMGARVIGNELAKTILKMWLDSEFAGRGSAIKVDRINEIDNYYRK